MVVIRNVAVFFLLILIFAGCKKDDVVEIKDETFPVDLEFEKVLFGLHIDNAINGLIRSSEVKRVDSLNIDGINALKSLKGIEHFENLRTLTIFDVRLDSLDLSKNTKLEYLSCRTVGREDYGRSLVYLDVRKCTALKFLDCSSNLISYLDVSNNKALTQLHCGDNENLKAIDISKNSELEILNCGFSPLTKLDVRNNVKLRELYCGKNDISDLDLSMLPNLEIFDCRATDIASLKIKYPEKMKGLYITDSKMISVDFNLFPNLQTLALGVNLESIDLRPLRLLKVLDVYGVNENTVDLSGNVNLEHLVVRVSNVQTLDLTHNTNLKILFLFALNNIKSVDIRPAKKLDSFVSSFNSNLKTICVNAVPDPNNLEWGKDDWTEWVVCK